MNITAVAALAASLSLLFLNATLTFANVWPTAKIKFGWALSVELAAVVLLLALAWRWADGLARRVLPGMWVLLVIGRYLDVTGRGLYGRDFNLYWDSAHFSNVAAMLVRDAPILLLVSVLGGLVLAWVAAFFVARLALGRVAAAMVHAGLRRSLAALATLVIALFAWQTATDPKGQAAAFAEPVAPGYVRQARFVLAMVGPGTLSPAIPPPPAALNATLEGLGGADVLVVFAESYGAVVYDSPEMSAALAASRADLDAAARETGRQVVSAYIDPPTFGASSWLAHLTLITGVDVRDQLTYTSMMTRPRDTLLTTFERRGYRTVALMPGLRQPWPEGAFYGFDVIYGRRQLEYGGPHFGWWSIPDQYSLAKLNALELDRPNRAPVFAFFPTSTMHAPFGPVAPYQPDWPRILRDDRFDTADVEQAMAVVPDLTNLRPSYVRATAYTFHTLAGYVRERAGRDLVIVILGDHQPPAAVSGPGAPWDVPAHIVAGRTPIVERLLARGFRRGMTPARPAAGAMHELVPALLDAFDAPDRRAGDEGYADTLNGSRLPPSAMAARPPRTGSP